ncbi:MAG: hypothetical protein AAF672_02520 [Pseudomonadota bacterium]
MDQITGRKLLAYLFGIVAIIAAMTLSKGGLYINRHEGDVLHLTEIVRRMSQGQWPHLDFVTPLGGISFVPMAALVAAGFGIGVSILLSQVLFALALVPAIYWVAQTRLEPAYRLAYGALILVMALALIHGEAAASLSLSMHYNRWAWCLAFLAVPIALFAPRGVERHWPDGLILGLAMSFFVLGKVTYAVALAPGLLLALGLRGAWRIMAVAVIVTILAALVPVMFAGPAYWTAFIADLLQVSGSGIRPRAGESWAALLLSPKFLVGNLLLLAAIVILRRDPERASLGLVLLVLAPGFLYITYQNYGNDPKWLALFAVILVAAGPAWPYRAGALAAALLIAPSFANMATSPIRHALVAKSEFVPVFSDAQHDDFFTPRARVFRVMERGTITFKDPQFAMLNEFADMEPDVEFAGMTYPSCVQDLGLLGMMRAVADDLRDIGLGDDARIFTADTFGGLWMFGGFTPLQGGAPWYYGDLSGFENADYLLVPTCPITPRAFKAILADIDARDAVELSLMRESELYRLYRLDQ